MEKAEIAGILDEISLLMQLAGENTFKIRAFENGARIVETLEEDLENLVEQDRLKDIKGIGATLEELIVEMVKTNQSSYYNELKENIPPGLIEMTEIPGLGPKKIKKIYDLLNITTIGELEYAALENRLAHLKGFGKKSQSNILQGIETLKKYSEKFLLSEALYYGEAIFKWVRKNPKVIRCSLAGSIRRRKEVIKDIDIIASCEERYRGEIMDYFLSYPEHTHTIGKGDTKSSMKITSGINIDIRLVSDSEYPYALHHFTGSKEHNTHLRQRAKQRGLKINEYGIFTDKDEIIPVKDEREFFKTLDLAYITPELRENRGEIQAAENNNLPNLIVKEDLKGVYHVHSNYSDGANSIEDLARHAINMNFKYIGISDHSSSAVYARGLNRETIIKKHSEIDKLNEKYPNITILKGVESDILADGSLDYEDDLLPHFDYVIASIHSNFHLPKDEMTNRIIRAVKNPYTKMLGHLTGRLLLSREGYDLDIQEVFKACAQHNVAIEINSNPHRLDLDWRYCKLAKEMGVKLAIEPDAHKLMDLDYIGFGISIARKGWLEPKDVINTYDHPFSQ